MQAAVQPILWQSLAWPGTIAHRHQASATGFDEQGVASGRTDQGSVFAYAYTLQLTAQWEIKMVAITSLLDDRRIALRRNGKQWFDEIAHTVLPQFDGVPFIDISVTPFTNSLPIHQLAFTADQPQQIQTIFFDENSFSLRKVLQYYTKKDDHTFQYTDVEIPDFTAELTTDADGIVLTYQHLFRRA